jgi:hypothetical protein
MDQKKSVPLDALLQAVSLGNVEPEVLSSVAVRLARLDAQLTDAERAKVGAEAGGLGLKELSRGIVQALDPREDRSPQEAEAALRHAVKPLSSPALRTLILTLKASKELVITYLLFLKMADERSRPPYSQPSPIPAAYAWPALLAKDGDALFDHYRHTLEELGRQSSRPAWPRRRSVSCRASRSRQRSLRRRRWRTSCRQASRCRPGPRLRGHALRPYPAPA